MTVASSGVSVVLRTGFDPTKGGPREPWHDIHSRLEGPVAYDVLHNFMDRWRKQAGITHRGDLIRLRDVEGLDIPDSVSLWWLQGNIRTLKGQVSFWLQMILNNDKIEHTCEYI